MVFPGARVAAARSLTKLKPLKCGRLAQLEERHVYTVDVGSSSLSPPTRSRLLMPKPPTPLAFTVVIVCGGLFGACATTIQYLSKSFTHESFRKLLDHLHKSLAHARHKLRAWCDMAADTRSIQQRFRTKTLKLRRYTRSAGPMMQVRTTGPVPLSAGSTLLFGVRERFSKSPWWYELWPAP